MSAAHRVERLTLVLMALVLVAFVVAPLAALMLSLAPAELVRGLSSPLAWEALRLSLITTAVSLAVVLGLGTPLAWVLARSNGRLARVVETLFQLPIVVPPAVAGVALLLTFGARGAFAGLLYPEGSTAGLSTFAVVLAQVFVAAPFYVQAATSAFRRLDPRVVAVARTLGASPLSVLWRVALPASLPALAAGAAMSWARALGEFGATLMFAGNLEGVTQTLPLAIYTALEADFEAAQALAIALVVVAFGLLLAVRALAARSERHAVRGAG